MIINKVLNYRIYLFLIQLLMNACGGGSSGSTTANTSTVNKSSAATGNHNNPNSSANQSVQPSDSTIQHLSLASNSLNTTMGFAVYLPANYNAEFKYPVL